MSKFLHDDANADDDAADDAMAMTIPQRFLRKAELKMSGQGTWNAMMYDAV